MPAEAGYALSEVPHNIDHGKLKAHYIMGEDPLQTEPDLATIRRTFEKLDLLIVQDIFMTKPPRLPTLFSRQPHGASMKGCIPRQTAASNASIKQWNQWAM
ncbi:Formate dehydrogenase H [Serratia fonticola]|uniref:Formate dehydrogenase H n=1 Tax=Serratia fonticola TaxID=47917 RepID=A0A4U9THW3_SERFO|nr:Formate dehydrogenase H [Serratia fonticola]